MSKDLPTAPVISNYLTQPEDKLWLVRVELHELKGKLELLEAKIEAIENTLAVILDKIGDEAMAEAILKFESDRGTL